jgi:hypothetical protein
MGLRKYNTYGQQIQSMSTGLVVAGGNPGTGSGSGGMQPFEARYAVDRFNTGANNRFF